MARNSSRPPYNIHEPSYLRVEDLGTLAFNKGHSSRSLLVELARIGRQMNIIFIIDVTLNT